MDSVLNMTLNYSSAFCVEPKMHTVLDMTLQLYHSCPWYDEKLSSSLFAFAPWLAALMPTTDIVQTIAPFDCIFTVSHYMTGLCPWYGISNYLCQWFGIFMDPTSWTLCTLSDCITITPYGCITWTRSHLCDVIDHTFRWILELFPWSQHKSHALLVFQTLYDLWGGVGNIPISFWDILTHMYMCCHSCLLCLLSCLHIIVIMLTSLPRTLTNGLYTFKLCL